MNRGKGRSRGGGGLGRGTGNRGKGRGRKVQAPLNFDVPEGGMTVYDRPSLGGDMEEPVGNGWGATVVSKPPIVLRNKAWASIASETSEAESTYGRDWMAREDQARQAPAVVSRVEVPDMPFPSPASHHAEQQGVASQDFPPLGNAAISQLPKSDAALQLQDYFPGLPASIDCKATGDASLNGNGRTGGEHCYRLATVMSIGILSIPTTFDCDVQRTKKLYRCCDDQGVDEEGNDENHIATYVVLNEKDIISIC